MTLDQYRTRRDAGECTGARGCENPRVQGRQRCEFHTDQQRARSIAWRSKVDRKAHELRQRREWIAANLCSKCGKIRVHYFKQCKPCRMAKCASAKRAGWYQDAKRARRRAA